MSLDEAVSRHARKRMERALSRHLRFAVVTPANDNSNGRAA